MLGLQPHPGPRQAPRYWLILAVALALAVAVPVFSAGTATAGVFPAISAQPAVNGAALKSTLLASRVASRVAGSYRVRSHDNLSGIAGKVYGHQNWWPELYWANRGKIRGRSMTIFPGERLTVPAPWAHRPRTPRVYHPYVPKPHRTAAPAASAATTVSYAPSSTGGSFGDCVRSRESGGNYGVWNASGHYGAYQFSAQTWAAYGGSPADFGHASPAEQDQVFANALAAGGSGNWTPYDGCQMAVSAVLMPGQHAAPAHHRRFMPLRLLAFWQALRYRGAWYAWGGTGPGGFDCSGLVYRSYLNLGHALPRTTYGMLAGGYHLHYTSHPRKGMLSFYGSGHVELYVRPGVTYGAHHSGTRVGYTHYSGYYHPTMFMWVSRH